MENFISALFIIGFFFLFLVSSSSLRGRFDLLKEKFPEEISRTGLDIAYTAARVPAATEIYFYMFFYILFQRYKKLNSKEVNSYFHPILIIVNIQFSCLILSVASRYI